MTKEERQKRSEERKAQRKEKALQRKKAQEEKAQEKVQLKREEHIEVFKRAKSLHQRTEAPSTAVREEDAPLIVDWHPEPSMSRRGMDLSEESTSSHQKTTFSAPCQRDCTALQPRPQI